jgi:DNA-binding MarR family transcriptional regulator
MDERAQRDLALLNSITEDQGHTQRTLSHNLGIALGLTNMYLKRFVRKGFVKCVNVRANRLRYLLTPKGIAEKTRLTYEFWDYSLHLYHEVRQHLRTVLSQSVKSGVQRIAIYGTGEAAELAYLSLKELGLEPVAIFDGRTGGSFLGMPVRALGEAGPPRYELMVLATLESPERLISELVSQGVEVGRLVTLRQPSAAGLVSGAGRQTPRPHTQPPESEQ